jgi:NADH-quinone oxidoreductase subunit L
MIISTIVAVSGIGLAYLMYYKKSISPDAIAEKIKPLYNFSYNKWYVDELYQVAVIDPILNFTKILWWFDANIIDGLVNFTAWFTVKWADLKQLFDKYVVDGSVNGLGYLCQAGGWILKFIQSGSVQFYTLVVIGSTVGIIIYRINADGFYIYLASILIVVIARLVARMFRLKEIG